MDMTNQALSPSDRRKDAAAKAAADRVVSGMVLGLGTGATATFFLYELARRLENGQLTDLVGVPTSTRTATQAQELGIPLTDLEANPLLDLAIDGADEIDPQGNVIKGGGGALLREKIVAQAANRFIIVAESAKCSPQLGMVWALPIEVIPFGLQTQLDFLAHLGGAPELRIADGAPYLTDSGNYIIDCRFEPRQDWSEIAHALEARAGIVEHGLFLNMAHELLIAEGGEDSGGEDSDHEDTGSEDSSGDIQVKSLIPPAR